MANRSFQMCMQCATCSMVSTCLCRALKFLSTRDSKIKAEAVKWPEGKTLRLEIPGARGFTVTGTRAGFKTLHPSTPGDVTIRFKSPADAFRVFTGQLSVAQAYAQHRFTLRGSMGLAMPFVRCVDIVEGYLFPAFMARRILKRLPKKEVSTARVYGAVLFGR
ncbi:MAG: SCP2 sterol-binding domain-containing protein [Ruminiclostridium sp.]|nr:SCP2 sterol-binding domain-containing protein [Ruminiclostridium sp.]MCI9465783.1 SCP2 sterol-binding domain-containing protein [Ruminiclostridium sp.]